jgi:seryl-tRNA synthetase
MVRDANLDAWAKGMATMVNTEAFAKSLGIQLDTMLAASAPMQKMVAQYMETSLAQAGMPSRAEVISLAQRMTNIEMRLDDMDARLDDILLAVRSLAVPTPAPAAIPEPVAEAAPVAEPAPAVDAEAAPEPTAEAESEPKSAARRIRKPATE